MLHKCHYSGERAPNAKSDAPLLACDSTTRPRTALLVLPCATRIPSEYNVPRGLAEEDGEEDIAVVVHPEKHAA